MTERVVVVLLWLLGIGTVLIVTFAMAAAVVPTDALGTTLPRSGWSVALAGWGVGGGAAILAIGRALSDGWPARAPIGSVLLALAIGAGVAVELTVMQWAAARFGEQAADPDLIGWSSLLSPMVVLVGLAALAGTVLPAAAGTAGRALTWAASAGVVLVVASNVPGAFDGITPPGVPMAIAMMVAAVVGVTAIGVSGVARRPRLPDR